MSEDRRDGTPTLEAPELTRIEAAAEERLDSETGLVEASLEAQAAPDATPLAPRRLPIRSLVAVALPAIAAGLMVGGVFHAGGLPEDPTTGIAPRVYACLAALLGIALAAGVSRLRNWAVVAVLAVIGIFAIGVLMTLPFGPGHLVSLSNDVNFALRQAHIARPPIDFLPGWAALTGWIMACIGFGAGWLAVAAELPSWGVLVPVVIAVIAGISIPKGGQVPSGIAAVGLFGAALAVLSGSQSVGSGDSLPAAYELRRALRAMPIFAGVLVGLYVLASSSNVLFPHQLIDPAQQPQKPHPISLSGAQDRDLFDVSNTTFTGPWVIGHLDVYDGTDWLLPSYQSSSNAFKPIPKSGIVDPSLTAGAKATFTIRGLTGAVLPDLPDTLGVVATGPRLVYDSRSANIRLVEGQVSPGFQYSVVAAGPAQVDQLTALGNNMSIPSYYQQFMAVSAPPPAVKALIDKAPKTSKWEEFNYLRSWVLENVTADGSGVPVDIPASRVEKIIDRKDGSPYEIVAVQALLARWVGLPSRIGYGFDGGKRVGDHVEVHPTNGVSFPEVFFPGFEWVPVVGTPVHARTTESGSKKQQVSGVLPSQNIGVPIYVPYLTQSGTQLYQQLAPYGGLALLALLIALLIYFSYPAAAKLIRRTRARAHARHEGPRAELALAYAEWRDLTTDYGYFHPADTPLQFTTRFVPDEEHSQFAWLVTRSLWGDLQGDITPALAAQGRLLSNRLRTRLAQGHPITVRAVAFFSRLSLRNPYQVPEQAPATAATRRVA